MCVRMYVYVCMYVHMYIHMYIHTDIRMLHVQYVCICMQYMHDKETWYKEPICRLELANDIIISVEVVTNYHIL